MSPRHTGREHKTRDKGRSIRAKVVRQVETVILSSSDTRVKAGERAKLQLMSDGSLRLLLCEQMGSARTHGYLLDAKGHSQSHCNGVLVDAIHTEDIYVIPEQAWLKAKGEAQP